VTLRWPNLRKVTEQRKEHVRHLMAIQDSDYRLAYQLGIRAAAELAGRMYDSTSTHVFRIEDCILAKFNMINGKPRRNRKYAKARGERP
jgi:hypothetical protein